MLDFMYRIILCHPCVIFLYETILCNPTNNLRLKLILFQNVKNAILKDKLKRNLIGIWSVVQKSDKLEISRISSQVPRYCDAHEYEVEDQHDLDAHKFELPMSSDEFDNIRYHVIFVTTALKTREV